MIASLPMYDRPETAAANDRLWQGVRAALGWGPERLTRGGDLWTQWLSPDLVLSQTCGYPYRAQLHGKVTLVATPDYGLRGCPPGHYCSVLVARADDPRTDLHAFAKAPFAYNEALSQSGWAAPQTHAQGLGFRFSNLIETGAHGASARAVADGRADLAALDALSWAMMRRHDAVAGALREIARTAPTPALPYITARGRDAGALFAALEQAIAGLDDRDRDALGLRGLCRLPAAAYLAVATPPPPAA
jgi:ABC-type phosphate/phosphonate transport system substrate-binding protein